MNDGGVEPLLSRAKHLHRNQRFDDAESLYRTILREQPTHFETLFLLGILKSQLRHHQASLDFLTSALESDPRSSEAWCEHGLVLQALNRAEQAVASYDQAIALDARSANAHSNRGNALFELKRVEEAVRSYDVAIALKPDFANAHSNRGNALVKLRRLDEALASCSRAIALNPRHAVAHNNRGKCLLELDRLEEALACFDRAIALKPDFANAHCNRGHALDRLKQQNEALASYRRALTLAPGHEVAFVGMASAAMQACDWTMRQKIASGLEQRVLAGSAAVHPFLLLGYSSSAQVQFRAARRWFENLAPTGNPALWRGEAYRHERIRLAYVSADFRHHATASLIAELIELHDRDKFEVVAVSFGPDDRSAMRRRLTDAFDRFYDAAGRPSGEIARIIREAEIDIAVDLKGFTSDSRPEIFAFRPAPIQVSYLGYPGTTGTPFLDYVLADPIVLPFDQQPFYAEKIVHLPGCYQVNDRKRPSMREAPSRAAAGLPETGFVFCSFNNNYKITPEIFDIWMRLLAEVEGSVLWLLRDNEAAARNLYAAARARNIEPSRLIFADRLPAERHLARHRLADLFLDTSPVNAHTTASDALWAGVPVITLLGESFVARVCSSLVTAAGLPELVTRSAEAYRALASRLARNPEELGALRLELEQNRGVCELFDTDRFRRGIEAAYMRMWDIQQRGEKPRSFAVNSLA